MSEDVVQETGQTGQKAKEAGAKQARFEVAQDKEGGWHWMLWSGNGLQVARSARSYERKKDCIQAVKLLKKLVPSVKYVVQAMV